MNKGTLIKIGFISCVSAVLLVVVSLLTVPMFLSTNNIRTRVVDSVNSKINGHLSIDSISLSLITGIKFKIKSVDLKDSNNESILKLKKGIVKLPLFSILKQHPKLTLELLEPDILIRQKNSQLNILTLINTSSNFYFSNSTKNTSQNESESKSDPLANQSKIDQDSHENFQAESISKSKSKSSSIEKLIQRSVFTVIVKDANFSFFKEEDEPIKVSDISFVMKDMSFKPGQTSSFSLDMNPNFKSEPDLYLKGPIHTDFKISPDSSIYSFEMNSNFNKLEYKIKKLLTKTPGQKANLSLKLMADFTKSKIDLLSCELNLPDLSIKTSGTLRNFNSKNPTTNIKNSIYLQRKNQDLSISNSILIKNTYNIDSSIRSNYLNISDLLLLVESDNEIKTEKSSNTLKNGSKSLKSSSKQNSTKTNSIALSDSLAKLLQNLTKNPVLKKLKLNLLLDIKKLSFNKINSQSIKGNFNFENMNFNSKLSLNISEGNLNLDFSSKLEDSSTPYNTAVSLTNIELSKTVPMLLPNYKHLLSGKVSTNIKAQGNLQSHDIIKNLKSSGNLSIKHPVISIVDLNVVIDNLLESVSSKIKDKFAYDLSSIEKFNSVKERLVKQKLSFDSGTSKFNLSEKVFNLTDFYLKATPQKGMDLRGKASINLNNEDLDSLFMLEDVYNLTKLQDVHLTHKGISIDHILVDGQYFKIPFAIKCKLSSPCYKYEESINCVTKVAEKNAEKTFKYKGEKIIKDQTDRLKKQFKSLFK